VRGSDQNQVNAKYLYYWMQKRTRHGIKIITGYRGGQGTVLEVRAIELGNEFGNRIW